MSGVPTDVAGSFASANEIDFSSSSGLQKLLAVVRATPMSRAEYNELRDLIFSYKQSGDNPEKKQQIITSLSNLGILTGGVDSKSVSKETVPDPGVNQVPVRIETESPKSATPQVTETVTQATEKPMNRSGMSRPTPSFAPVSVSNQAVNETSIPESVVTSQPASIRPEQSTLPSTSGTPPPAPQPASAAVAPSTPSTEPKLAQSTPVIPPQPASASASDQLSQPTVTNGSVETQVSTDPLERIKAIKREVNASVGNPVNLIDANNEIGREYMNALLDAMKKVNGQQSAEIASAMERLEKAFVAVKSVQIEKPEPKKETTVPAEPIESTVQPMSLDTAETAQSEAQEETPPPATNMPLASNIDEPLEPVPTSEIIPDAGLPKSKLFEAVVVDEEVNTSQPANAMTSATSSVPPSTTGAFTSVAAVKAQQNEEVSEAISATEAAQAEEAAKEAAMDPVMTSDVTNGLNQLLSEWKLFKSSGIFGTGPSGAEHPLYKRLASMHMSQVIAGRFEGATPEVKQSITDYMNGWRYEEGIIHKHGETFEHYLRRVIRKILDKQKVTVE